MNVDVIIQARMGSTRLPGKVLRSLNGKPMLHHIVQRVSQATLVRNVAVATSNLPDDDKIESFCKKYFPSYICFRGSEEDVLDRYYKCAKLMGSDIVVRLTGDNPFVDPEVIDAAIASFLKEGNLDYLSYREGLPLGIGAEVCVFEALQRAWRDASDPECREHVTPYFYRTEDLFSWKREPLIGEDYSKYRLTVDTHEDFDTAEKLYEIIEENALGYSFKTVIDILRMHPEVVSNSDIVQKSVHFGSDNA